MTTTYWIKVPVDGKLVQWTVQRKQFPLTAAYAFTDYRSQGQTIANVLVDIASPPSGMLSLFNLYLALSRSSGWETIRLLRHFDEDIFMVEHNPILIVEDKQLEALDIETRKWYEKAVVSYCCLQKTWQNSNRHKIGAWNLCRPYLKNNLLDCLSLFCVTLSYMYCRAWCS